MFYKITPELSKETAQQMAKLGRKNLVQSFIVKYKHLSTFNRDPQKSPELTRFLNLFLQKIEHMNHCNNAIDQIAPSLQYHLDSLRDLPCFATVQEHLKQCTTEIANEIQQAQDREKFNIQNKIARIKNNAIYVANFSTIAAVVGAVLSLFFPAGLLVVGAAIATLILSELLFWIQNYKQYQQLHTKIQHRDLTIDYAEGFAVPWEEVPQDPNQSSTTPVHVVQEKSQNPVLISEEADKMLDAVSTVGAEIVELGTEFVADIRDLAYRNASASIYSIWSAVTSTTGAPASKLCDHLHQL